MDDQELADLVASGASLATIAHRAGATAPAVRARIVALGLETRRMRRLRENASARGDGRRTVTRTCPRHGQVEHRLDARATYRCGRCNAERVAARRRSIKRTLVAEAGGRCVSCGYDRCSAALQFHHRDPSAKAFGLAYEGMVRSLDAARAEAAKCVLLCANCHAEVEAGITSPDGMPR